MKKIMLFIGLLLSQHLLSAQVAGYELGNQSITSEIAVPNSSDAAIVKSATIDLPNNTSLVGIIWSNNTNNGYLYVDDINNSTFTPPLTTITSTAPFNIDPGYLIGNVDVAMVPYHDATWGSTVYGALLKVMYQRRLTATANWEVVVKTFMSNSLTGITNLTQIGATWNLGTGKHVAIDAFVHADKLSPSIGNFTFDYFTIGWGTVNGYEVRIIDINDNVYNANLLPYTFTPNHMRNDSVTHIDLASVRQVGVPPSGVAPDDKVYIVVREACANNMSCESHIWEWSVDYALGGAGILVPIDTIHGNSLSGRFRIEAMSIQNDALNEPKYNVLVCLDGTVVFYYSRIGTTNYDLNTLPTEFIDPLTSIITSGGPGETFDIAGGIGFYGNSTYVANRHYHILREMDIADYVFVSGLMRDNLTLSYPTGTPGVKVEDISEVPNFPRIVNNNDGMPTWGYPGLYNPKLFDNISTTSSTNSGKCILNAWTNRAGGFLQGTNAIFFKIKQAEDDLTATPPTPPTHWNAKSNNIIESATLRLYPNPAKDILYIQHDQWAIKTIKVYSIDGKILNMNQQIEQNFAIISTDGLVSGNYIIQIVFENDKMMQQVFVKD